MPVNKLESRFEKVIASLAVTKGKEQCLKNQVNYFKKKLKQYSKWSYDPPENEIEDIANHVFIQGFCYGVLIMNELAHTYRALGNFQKALDIAMECLDWFPRDDGIYHNIALFYNDLGQYQKAIEAAEKSLQLNKRGGRAYSYQGFAYMKLGELETARKLLEKAIEIDPYFARSYYNMALYYLEVNQKEKGLEFCEKSLQVNVNFAESKDLKEILTT